MNFYFDKTSEFFGIEFYVLAERRHFFKTRHLHKYYQPYFAQNQKSYIPDDISNDSAALVLVNVKLLFFFLKREEKTTPNEM